MKAADSLEQLKNHLKPAAINVNVTSLQPPPLGGVFHLLHTDPVKGLLMHELTKLAATDELNYLSSMGIEQLDVRLFGQVAQRKMFECFACYKSRENL